MKREDLARLFARARELDAREAERARRALEEDRRWLRSRGRPRRPAR